MSEIGPSANPNTPRESQLPGDRLNEDSWNSSPRGEGQEMMLVGRNGSNRIAHPPYDVAAIDAAIAWNANVQRSALLLAEPSFHFIEGGRAFRGSPNFDQQTFENTMLRRDARPFYAATPGLDYYVNAQERRPPLKRKLHRTGEVKGCLCVLHIRLRVQYHFIGPDGPKPSDIAPKEPDSGTTGTGSTPTGRWDSTPATEVSNETGEDGVQIIVYTYDVVEKKYLANNCVEVTIWHVFLIFIVIPAAKGGNGKKIVPPTEEDILDWTKDALALCLKQYIKMIDGDKEYSGADPTQWNDARQEAAVELMTEKYQVLVVVIMHGDSIDLMPWDALVKLAKGASNVIALGCAVDNSSLAGRSAWHSEGNVDIGGPSADPKKDGRANLFARGLSLTGNMQKEVETMNGSLPDDHKKYGKPTASDK